jgi:hypothetical protein
MADMDYGAIIGMIGQMAGAAAGRAASQMDQDKAMALIQSAMDEFGKIDVPSLQKLLLSKAPDTELSKIKDDPAYRAQQMSADSQLNDVINSGGLTLADKAALNAIQAKVQRGESAGRHAIEGQMAARGTLDSGAQLAMSLANQQNSANSQAEAGERTAGAAQARAYAAIQQRAQNAGQGLDRSYRQQSNAASAQDAINQGNNAIANTAARYNAGLPQQDFTNKLNLANAKAQPGYTMAGWHAGQAKDTQQFGERMGKLGGKAVGAYVNGNNNGANNTPDFEQGFGPGGSSSGTDDNFTAFPGSSSDGLSGAPTRGGSIIVGYTEDGQPIYGHRKA